MIEYDYLLERNTGNEVKKMKPIPQNIPLKIDNCTMIAGPNGKGKSTLLNIIAYGLYGKQNDNISDGIKTKMIGLCEGEHNKITFNFHIMTDDKNGLFCIKDDDGHKVYEVINGENKLLTCESFNRKYNLIYDIPEDPTNRLKGLIGQVEEKQKDIANKIQEIKKYLNGLIVEVSNSKDPKRIENMSEEIKKNEVRLSNLKIEESKNKTQYDFLNKYMSLRFHKEYEEQKIQVEKDIKKVQKKLDKLGSGIVVKNTIVNKCEVSIEKANKSIDVAINSYKAIFDCLDDLDIKYYKELWGKNHINKGEILNNCEVDRKVKTSASLVLEFLDKEIIKFSGTAKYKKAQMISELIKVLEKYKDIYEFKIPGITKSIFDVVEDLKLESSKFNEIEGKEKRYKDLKCKILDFCKYMKELESILAEIKEIRQNAHSSNDNTIKEKQLLEYQLIRLNNSYKELDRLYKKYYQKYLESGEIQKDELVSIMGSEYYKFARFGENQLNDILDSFEIKIIENNNNINDLNKIIEHDQRELAKLSNQKHHEYFDKKEMLLKLFEIINYMEQCFKVRYKEYSANLNQGRAAVDVSEKKYQELIYQYLAEKMGKIKHIDKYYTPIKIDFIERIIYTDVGEDIYFSDMGTGQGQAAYLKTLLQSSNNDKGRKIIALLDEVAMMDSTSLGSIKEELSNLKKSGNLLAAIIVKISDEFLVTSLN